MFKWLSNLLVKGTVEARKLITTSGTSREFVKGDGSLDPTSYLPYVDFYRGNQILQYSYYNIPGTYQYYVVVPRYIFDSEVFETPIIGTVTLSHGHPTLDRRDSIVLNVDGTITVEEGVPATNPSTAILNNETQLEIFEVFVTANSTSPTDVNSTIVYDENLQEQGGEWDTHSSDNANIQLENTERAFMGTKSIFFVNPPSENKATLSTTAPIYIRDYDTLVLSVWPKEPDAEIDVTLYDQSDRYLTKYKIQAGNYGMGEDLHMWYPIVIDITTGFLRQEETQISKIEIELVKNSKNCHVDYILFQGGNQSEIGLQHNSLDGKQGGNPLRDEFYHLSEEDYERVRNMELPSGLEAIDEGNGIGWRLKGVNPDNYGNIGKGAVDLGDSDLPSTTVGATGTQSKVGGGLRNTASGNQSTVGGGVINEASGSQSTVGGGVQNEASGSMSTVSGGAYNTASGSQSTVGGGYNNEASSNSSTVSGGNQNKASSENSTVSGGAGNEASGDNSTVSGGAGNKASGDNSTVGGGAGNKASGSRSTVGGGLENIASNIYSTVGGGLENQASGNQSTVGGGAINEASSENSTVSGGAGNKASGDNSTVGGGLYNQASAIYSTVGGGYNNKASGLQSTVGGGDSNKASAIYSTVGGGWQNEAIGNYSTIGGGVQNIAKTLGEFLGGIWSTIKEGNATTWIGTDRIFGIGNGKSSNQRSDAFNVYKNGVAELPSVNNGLIDAAGPKTIPTKEWVKNSFTTQIIDSGGNYNDLEVTADLLVFTNENAQAIINGVHGRKDFHILNLSSQYEVRINHDSPSVSGDGIALKLPTATGFMGVKGTARVLYYESYGYFVSDTWASLYRPEYQGLTEERVMTVDENSRAGSMGMTEYEVFRDGQTTPMSKADLNNAYPDAVRPFNVICSNIGKVYKKINDNTGDWLPLRFEQENEATLYTIKKTLTASQIHNATTNPVELIAAPGTGKAIILVSGTLKLNFNSEAFDPLMVYLKNSTAANEQMTTAGSALIANGGSTMFTLKPNQREGNVIENETIVLETTQNSTNGDGTIDIHLTYQIIKL